MKLQAIRGKNQRGIAFLPESMVIQSEIGRIIYDGEYVYASLRIDPRIPDGSIILDKKHFDSLRMDEDTSIEIEYIEEDIPNCTELSFQVLSERPLDSDKIVDALSEKIEDMEPYVEGLILEVGSKIFIEELGISLITTSITPSERTLNIAMIRWALVLKVFLEAKSKSHSLNLIILAEIGASFHKDDVSEESGPIPRNVLSHRFLIDFLENAKKSELKLFSCVLYSESIVTFPSNTKRKFGEIDLGSLSNWYDRNQSEHSKKHSNPSLGLDKVFDIASQMQLENQLPVFILFISSGTYSQGTNPIPLVRSLLSSTENIFIGCIGIGSSIDDAIISEIAKIGNGILQTLNHTSQIEETRKSVLSWIDKEL